MWLETIEDIKAHATDFFSTLLTVDAAAPDVQAVDQMLDFIPSIVEEVDNVHLLRPIELDEVRKAVFGLDPDSAPWPRWLFLANFSKLLGTL